MSLHSPKIQTTADGSVTLYREDIDEHYHSSKGALAESLHVYIELGWKAAAERLSAVKVFEVGFGTGLNAALTAAMAERYKIPTSYCAVELFPLSKDLTDILSSFQPEDYAGFFRKVNDAPWDDDIKISPFFTLRKIKGDLLKISIPEGVDVVYFDAFAPEKQPEMWSESLFRRFFEAMNHGGILTTYCAKGAIRRMSQTIGFFAERLAGPPGGKREVLRISKPLSPTH